MVVVGAKERVVYLFGSGATQAELTRIGKNDVLTTPMINERIFDEKLKNKTIKDYFSVVDSKYLNIEHIISLFESFDIKQFTDISRILRTLFQKDILENLMYNGNYPDPFLTIILLEMHKNTEVRRIEELCGIISLNYDSMLDIAFMRVHNGVNYSMSCDSRTYNTKPTDTPPLIKMHGSFNWKSGSPIYITESKCFLHSNSSLWIAPSIFKKTDNYPFNYLWGKAFELLKCDVLRIIGSSLNQNDWSLLSLIFKAQFIHKKSFSIEVIDKPDVAESIKHRCGFLKNVKSLKEIELKMKIIGNKSNFFEIWLKEKLKSFSDAIEEGEENDNINRLIRKLNYEI